MIQFENQRSLDINPEDRRAMIKEENCVNCGACMSSCPFGAISDKSLIVPVAKRLDRRKLCMQLLHQLLQVNLE